MPAPKLTPVELQIMRVLWERGAASVREIQETFPRRKRPAYTTVQTVVYRLEAKKALRRARKIGNAHVFEPLITQHDAQGRLLDEVLGLFGGRAQPLISHLVESGRLSLQDVEEAAEMLRKLDRDPEHPDTEE